MVVDVIPENACATSEISGYSGSSSASPGMTVSEGLRRMRSQRRWMNGLGCLTIASEICPDRRRCARSFLHALHLDRFTGYIVV